MRNGTLHSTLIDLSSPEKPEVIYGEMVETTADSPLGQSDDLVQHGTNRRSPEAEALIGAVTLSPETRPLDEYESPLTLELMRQRYTELYSSATECRFYNEIEGTPEWEAVRQQGKKEITREFLHKPGLPSDFIKYLDIDVEPTRQLLDDIYFSIPKEIDRDNHVNNFDQRSQRVKAHIFEMHQDDPDIADDLQTTIDIWCEDLKLRAKMLGGEKRPKQNSLAEKREQYLQKLITGEASRDILIHNIGNTLLHATDQEKAQFEKRVKGLELDARTAIGSIAMLATFIEQYHPVPVQ
ncbi:hypothetical protein BH23PAT2_BH23PAT2_07790 [soil metagenome]